LNIKSARCVEWPEMPMLILANRKNLGLQFARRL